MTKKTSLNNIIGIVKTDEPTNSVDEVRKLRGRDGMTDEYEIIKDFCDWLSCQGLAYETLYYGTSKDVEKLIEKYLKSKME